MTNFTWLRVLSVLIPLCLFAGSLRLLRKARTLCTVLMVLGSGCLLGVVLTHIPEGLRSWTNWLAVAGLATFSGSFLASALKK
jgi:hypothetical protein